MLKPERCQMKVECCEQCGHWEPVPFHDRGGVCLLRRKAPSYWRIAGTSQNPSARASQKPVRVAIGLGG